MSSAEPQEMSKDVLAFRSTVFSLDPPADHWGSQHDCPLGDDIAAFFANTLPKRFPRWNCGDPIREDSWSSLDCEQDGRRLAIVVNYFPLEGDDNQWVMQFTQDTGVFWFLRRRRPDLLLDLINCIEVVVADSPDHFADVRWLSEAEFLSLA